MAAKSIALLRTEITALSAFPPATADQQEEKATGLFAEAHALTQDGVRCEDALKAAERLQRRSLRQRKATAPVKHWLISLHAAPGVNFHGYLMATDQRHTIAAANRMLADAEKIGPPHYPPRTMVMVTALATNLALVREIFAARSPEVRRLLETAVDFHFTVFAARAGDDDDTRLMELH